MIKKARISYNDSDTVWNILGKVLKELERQKPRKRFRKITKRAVLIAQNNRCKNCWGLLEVPEFDHIDGDRSNNSYNNCQALCPNCHSKKTRKRKIF